MVEGRILIAGIMLLIFAVDGRDGVHLSAARRGFLPLVIGIPGLVLSHHPVRDRAARARRGREGRSPPKTAWPNSRCSAGSSSSSSGIILFGFPYAGPLIVALYLHFSWGEKWYVSLGAAAFAWAVLHGIFDYVLGLPLFEGLVYQWIYG